MANKRRDKEHWVFRFNGDRDADERPTRPAPSAFPKDGLIRSSKPSVVPDATPVHQLTLQGPRGVVGLENGVHIVPSREWLYDIRKCRPVSLRFLNQSSPVTVNEYGSADIMSWVSPTVRYRITLEKVFVCPALTEPCVGTAWLFDKFPREAYPRRLFSREGQVGTVFSKILYRSKADEASNILDVSYVKPSRSQCSKRESRLPPD